MIDINNLKYQYENKKFLLDIERLSIKNNGIVAIVGPNGSGKSTLLKIISGVIKNYIGSVKTVGIEISEYSVKDYAKMVSLVSADSLHLPSVTLKYLVSAGRFPYIGNFGFLRGEDEDKIRESLCSVDLADKGDFYIGQLSSGELQRGLIARSLAQDTDIIAMDEPLSNLDPSHILDIINLLNDMKKKKLILITIHDINTAVKISDKMIGLKDGKIFFQFDNRNEIDIQLLSKLFAVNFEIVNNNVILKI